MPQSRFPSRIDHAPTVRARPARWLAALAALALAGCSDDATCGPGAATADGATLTVDGQTFRYGGWIGGQNNDCNIIGTGVISVTVAGTQTGDTSPLTLCLPRPDLLDATPVALTHDRIPPAADDRAQLIDAVAVLAGGCVARLDSTLPLAATASFTGLCDDGGDPAGFAVTLAGTIPVNVTCGGGAPTASTATLGGTVAVTVLPR